MQNRGRFYLEKQTCCITFVLLKQRRESRTIFHIKVDWETLQIIMKCRDKLSRPMAGPKFSCRTAFMPGGLQRTTSTQILSYRSFIASFDVGLISRKELNMIHSGFFNIFALEKLIIML